MEARGQERTLSHRRQAAGAAGVEREALSSDEARQLRLCGPRCHDTQETQARTPGSNEELQPRQRVEERVWGRRAQQGHSPSVPFPLLSARFLQISMQTHSQSLDFLVDFRFYIGV